MTEIEELNKKADTLLKDFSSLAIVIRYQKLKKALEEDTYLQGLKKQRQTMQDSLRYLKDARKDEAMSICKQLQIEYETSPLVVNFLSTKEEILQLIQPLTEAKL